MLYIHDVTVPANTTQNDPYEKMIKVWKGVIHSIEVFVPEGHHQLAHLQVFHGGHIIMPTNENGDVHGNACWVRGKFFIYLPKETNQLRFVGWNTDTAEAHTFVAHIGVLPKFALMPVGATEGIIAAMRSIFVKPEVV